MDETILFSEYGKASAVPSPVNRMMAAFDAHFREEVDINLGVGYVNERTVPRAWIEEAVGEVLGNPEKYRFALNYGGPAGSPNLIESIRRFYVKQRAGRLTDDVLARNRIVIGPNGATSLLEGIAQVMSPGIVVTSDPVYYIYCDTLDRLGFEVVAVPEEEGGLDPDRLEARLESLGRRKSDIRFLYLVTVNNPTCSILENGQRRRLVEIATRLSRELGRKVPLFFDTAYDNLIHDPAAEEPESGLVDDELGIVYEIGTLSKILAPALRIGYLIGADGPFLRAMVQKTSDSGFSAPMINQEIASYLLDHYATQQIEKVNAGYRHKAVETGRWIDANLGEFLEACSGGSAGFYFYLTFKQIETHENSPLFHFLSRTTGREAIDGPAGRTNPRVLYIPGEFCVHARGELVKRGRRQLRLSYGFEDLERIEEALNLMREAALYVRSI